MLWVHGDYCPVVEQRCVEHHPEYLARRGDPTVSERCLRYASPSRCLAPRQPLSFCMDRFEYPNRTGELPRVLTNWHEARRLCAAEGKRLCDEDEFNFACEGPEMSPYATGFERDPTRCNIDRPYRQPDHSKRMKTYDSCPEDAFCAAEMARLDQRHRLGERQTCVSWAGVVDLNGNVNEWVVRKGQEPPNRSGLKGGWWGPVRNRCRPTVGFHKESDYGYEAGFRCCRDPDARP
jgi:formylglycine-generating enzyme required for sulfatase activity